jgi:hypothetical protein
MTFIVVEILTVLYHPERIKVSNHTHLQGDGGYHLISFVFFSFDGLFVSPR